MKNPIKESNGQNLSGVAAAAHNRWEDIFQAIGHPSFILTTDQTIVNSNNALSRLTGKPPEYFLGKKCCEIFHGRGLPPDECPARKLIQSGSFETVEMEMEALGRTFLVSCSPLLDEAGTLYRIIHIATDITETKQMERKIRETDVKFRTLFESGAEGILVARLKDRKFKYANPAACRMFGYTEDDMVSLGVDEIHPAESLKQAIEHFNLQASGNKSPALDIPCKRKDGTIFYAHITAANAMIDGEPCNIGFFMDATDLRRTREKLREERDRAHKYLNIAAVMLVAIGAKGDVMLINKKGCEILGRDEADIIGKNWFENFLPECSRKKVQGAFKQIMAGEIKPVEYFENPVLRNDGQERIIEWHNTILWSEDGAIVGTLSSGTDITERKRNEQMLHEYQERLKALAADLSLAEERERRRIAVSVHDDLAQKITMSKFRLQSLMSTVSDKNIRAALNSESNLMGDILDDTRTLTFELSNPLLYEVGLDVAIKHWLKSDIQKKTGLKCEFISADGTSELGEEVKIVLFRAVRELSVNVIKYAGAKTIKVSIAKQGSNIIVTVEDDGCGFDTGKLGLPSGSKGGFGLFNIKERLEYMGGRLEITSESGKGTKVVMTIPAKKAG